MSRSKGDLIDDADDQKWPEWLIQFPPLPASRNTNNREKVRVESQVKQTNPLRKVNREHRHLSTQQLALRETDPMTVPTNSKRCIEASGLQRT